MADKHYCFVREALWNIEKDSRLNIIKLFAKVEDVVEISNKVTLSKLRDYHIWSDEYVMMRMNYNPSKPMSVLLLRIYKIKKPLIIDINDKWSGCKSWIDI